MRWQQRIGKCLALPKSSWSDLQTEIRNPCQRRRTRHPSCPSLRQWLTVWKSLQHMSRPRSSWEPWSSLPRLRRDTRRLGPRWNCSPATGRCRPTCPVWWRSCGRWCLWWVRWIWGTARRLPCRRPRSNPSKIWLLQGHQDAKKGRLRWNPKKCRRTSSCPRRLPLQYFLQLPTNC